MGIINSNGGRRNFAHFGQIITREEYDALMSELVLGSEFEVIPPIAEAEVNMEGFESMVFNLCR